ncbi:MAG: hypothetical protein KatS3mg036_0702 [Ignavibacterium sp.]|nr:MAG: hypothetical protein KatS3mg036_0702 [Ignavibacterium sp.]
MISESNKFSLGFINLSSVVKNIYNGLKYHFNLNENEVKILIFTYTCKPNSIRKISEYFSLSPTLTSKILSSLEVKHLIIRQINKNDKRFENVILTDKGIRITCMLMENIEKTFCKNISEILKNDCETLPGFFKIINENINTQSQLINLN